MSFFTLSDNKQANSNGQFELGGAIEPIPAKTQAKSIIDEAKWDEYNGERYISLRWVIIDGAHKNRKLFQKIKVADSDPKKRDKAISMLAAIDANAGGKLMAAGKEPTDMDLALALCNKPMIIRIELWELDDGRKGNWIGAVAPATKSAQQATVAPQGATQASGDDIPW